MFQLKKNELLVGKSKLIEEYEKELLERFYGNVPQDEKNPAGDGSFLEFRNSMTEINDKIYKKIFKAGYGTEVDLERKKISYNYSMYLEAVLDPFDSSSLNKKRGIVDIKRGIEPYPGCYLALASMKKGEASLFWISSELMFGKLGKAELKSDYVRYLTNEISGCPPRVPPAADILFIAKIVTSDLGSPVDIRKESCKSFEALWRAAVNGHKIAIKHFEKQNFSNAIDTFRKWIDKLEDAHLKTDAEEENQKLLLVKMYQNIAVCYNKMGKPERACVMIRELEKLIHIDNNPKALYAKGKANMILKNFKEARSCFLKAERVATSGSICNAIIELSLQERKQAELKSNVESQIRKFEAEAIQIAEKSCKEGDVMQKAKDEMLKSVDAFRSKLAETIEEFKHNKMIECLPLGAFIKSHHEINVAEKLCAQHNIRFMGAQLLNGEKTIYYLAK